ncbi:MAG: glycosyltransferase family 2 protein [Planctomycetes bacterium]|nr:glycosyltransferase family 2 protein [Planctomycetota bacterium]
MSLEASGSKICSIIIVNWNTCQILDDCLASLRNSLREDAEQYEVIIIDNASSDGSVDMIKAKYGEYALIENQENRGFAAANNQGLECARGEFYLLLNSDTIVLGEAIQNSIKYMMTQRKVGVMGCRVLNQDRSLQETCFMYPSLLNLILKTTGLHKIRKHDFFCREYMSNWRRDDEREVEVVTGCFMLVRARACQFVGFLDEDFFFFGEETDWCYRFKQAGWLVKFAPVGEIVHLGGASSKNSLRRDLLLSQGLVRFHAKHGGFANTLSAYLILALFNSSRVFFWWFHYLLNRKEFNKNRALHFTQVTLGFLKAWPKVAKT